MNITKILAAFLFFVASLSFAQKPQTTINGTPPPYVFNGAGVSQLGQTFTFSLPTATAAGQKLVATGAGTTYNAIGDSRVPVELYGAVGYSTYAAAVAGTDSTAAIQACLNALTAGQCQLQPLYYRTTAALTISKGNVGIVGPDITRGGMVASLVDTSATGDIIDLAGTSTAYIAFNVFRNFSMFRSVVDTGTDSGFHGTFAGGVRVENVHSADSLYPFYAHAMPSYGNGGFFSDSAEWCDNGLTKPTGGTPLGFFFDSSDGVAENSLYSENDSAGNNCGSNISAIGWAAKGTATNDIDVFNFGSAHMDIGHEIVNTGPAGANSAADVHVNVETDDGVYTGGGLISGLTATATGSVEESGGYEFGNPGTVLYGIEVLNSTGVTISHVQLGGVYAGAGATYGDGVLLSGSSNNSIIGNNCQYANPCVYANLSSSNNTITGNISTGATQGFLAANNSNNNTFTSNTCAAMASPYTCLAFQSGSTGNQYIANTGDSSVTTPVSDTSGGVNGNVVGTFTTEYAGTASSNVLQTLAPNLATGQSVGSYMGTAATPNNIAIWDFSNAGGAGSSSNYVKLGIYNSGGYGEDAWPNGSFTFGQTTPAAGPANGIGVGLTTQFQVDGNGNETHATTKASGTPTIACGTGAGTSPTVCSITGNDDAGQISVTTGTAPASSATIATITRANACPTTVYAVVRGSNAAAASLTGTTHEYPDGFTAGSWTLTSNTTGLTASTAYTWAYIAKCN